MLSKLFKYNRGYISPFFNLSFHYYLGQKFFLITIVISSLTHWLFRCVLLNCQNLRTLVITYILICSLIENTLCRMLINWWGWYDNLIREGKPFQQMLLEWVGGKLTWEINLWPLHYATNKNQFEIDPKAKTTELLENMF